MKGGYDGLLTEADIEFMRAAQDEIYAYRERLIDVIYFEKVYDDFTGELIDETAVTREVNAVVTELSNRSKDGERHLINGIEYRDGDAKFDVKIEAIADIIDKLERIEFDSKSYEILGDDKKGIGKRNRYEIIGRVIAWILTLK